jgi:DNA topoisomerase VI subunit B
MKDRASLLSVGFGIVVAILPLMFAGLLGSSWGEMTRLGRVGVGVSAAVLQAICLYLFQSAGQHGGTG